MYVLITGASSGIGKELAKLFSNDGYDLILVARNKTKLNELAKELKNNVLVKSYDLSDIKKCYLLFEEIKGLDIAYFINNAGFGNLGFFSETDIEIENNMLQLNINAVHTLTKLFIQNYEQGDVVNISSLAAFVPTPTFATYAASKSYVYYLSRAINYELKKQRRNNRVLTVTPGPVKTNFNTKAKAKVNRGMDVKKCAFIIFKGIKKRKSLIIPGFFMKITYLLIKFIPTKLLLKSSYKIQTKK